MPDYETIQSIVEEMLANGIEDRDTIVAAASERMDVDDDEMRRVYFTKAVSWALTKVRDDLGKRLVYQVRESGKHLVVHVGRTTNYQLIYKIATQKTEAGERLQAEGARLRMIAEQIELDFGSAYVA